MKRAFLVSLALLAALLVAPTPASAATFAPGTLYARGDIVTYQGALYIAEHDNPGYVPTVSTWYWDPFTWWGGLDFTSAHFSASFPDRLPLYTYNAFLNGQSHDYAMGKVGTDTAKKRELAAFFANVDHESGGLRYVREGDHGQYANYCNASLSYGCPAGVAMYFGRGPVQLTWNYNYKTTGDAIGVDLLNHPELVETDGNLAWRTATYFWNNKKGARPQTSHDAMVNGLGFGETIRVINGIECNGGKPAAVAHRVALYQEYAALLGVTPGENLSC